ncbi:Erv1/Alr family FAD-linked sulfhydryl oxidase [bacterium]|nr:Erv1/Alr family FAD-linked sulfhydryl oxidase [bacterium]
MVAKEIWGNLCWYLFHSSAYRLKEDRVDLIPKFINIFINICHNLPCPDCREHSKKILSRVNFRQIKTKESLVNFLFEYHNIVNKKLKKTEYSRKQHDKLYQRSKLDNILKKWNRVIKMESHNQHDMMMSVSKNNMRNKVLDFFKTNKNGFNF